MSTEAQGAILLALARAAIAAGPEATPATPADAAWLDQPGACFVTLTQGGELRGCIGSLEAHRALRDDIIANARAAAWRDPRFPPLTSAELPRTRIEVSLLSPLQPLSFASEADARAQLRPGVDGVVLAYGARRGTFLPQVWEQLPDPATFMAHLKAKAGLDPHFWSETIQLYRYTVAKWKGHF
jgi:AmmeMemoRadiSam system protein A